MTLDDKKSKKTDKGDKGDKGDKLEKSPSLAVLHGEKLFNPKIEYEVVLTKFKEEFQRKWDVNSPSPETGLEGYEDLATLGSGSFGKVVSAQFFTKVN